VLAVYTWDYLNPMVRVTCNNNVAAGATWSQVKFAAAAGTVYFVAVDGVNGARGRITLNWLLGKRPVIIPPANTNLTVPLGEPIILQAVVSNATPDLSCRWFCDGRLIAGATNRTLTLSNVQSNQAGLYTLAASNFVGMATGVVARLTVEGPFRLGYALSQTQPIQFRLSGVGGRPFVVEATTNLAQWRPVWTNAEPNAPLNFLETEAGLFDWRFYRAVAWTNGPPNP
jgi:hypothetical protein